jgi:hypothetical protein
VYIALAGLVVLQVLGMYPLWRVAKATSDRAADAKFAWVPIANVILMCAIARKTAWLTLALLVSTISILVGVGGGILGFPLMFWLWLHIGRRFGRTGLGAAAGLVPIVGVWAFALSVEPETAIPGGTTAELSPQP